jgi:threonine aldolase
MSEAQVGDDVLGDDPTVIRLQERVAELMGKEAACFVPSGTMANLSSIRALTEPGDEIIAHEDSHIYHYESGGYAAVSGCSIRFLKGERGQFDAADIEGALRPANSHFAHSALVVVENTQNRGGGSVWPMDRVQAVTAKARHHGLKCHLDGARLMNACVTSKTKASEYAEHFDTVATCFSKGLGAPAGSAVAGSNDVINRVHRYRKMFGGTMRQSGILAAAAIYALDHHVERLADDHAAAKKISGALSELRGIDIDPHAVETNIAYFDIDESHGDAASFCRRAESFGVRMLPIGPQRVRAVLHLDVSANQVDEAIRILKKVANAPAVVS